MRSRIDYRFLRAVTNPTTGDEATIGVLHWDSQRLRFAHALRSVPEELRGEVKHVLNSIKDRVAQVPTGQRNPLAQGIADVFPVPEGRGSLLRWAKPVSGLCSSGQQHFVQLVEAAGLSTGAHKNRVSKGLSP